MRSVLRAVLFVAVTTLLPAAAFAQASIAGSAKDASGASLPGVTVEAASPVLIEKVRTAVTDDRGLFRIVGLPPGTYTVTFALPGFNQVKREGIELSGSFIAQIDGELTVGGVTETITVSGTTPIVDVQSIRRQTTISSEMLTSIPTARSWAATALLIPGIVTIGGGPTDVQVTPQMTVFGGAGGRSNEGRMQVDGLNVGAGLGGSGVSTYIADLSNAQEVVTTTSGGLGEAEVGGPTLSIIPKSGGNTIAGNAYLSGVAGGMIGSNYSDELRAAGLTTPGKLLKQWDFTFGIGGPIIKDRLWYRVAARDEGQHRTISNVFPNLNASDPTKFSYAPDRSREVRGAESWRLYTVRLTAQATSRDKFNLHWDEQHACNGSTFSTGEDGCRNQPESGSVYGPLGLGGLSPTTSPEIGGYLDAHPRVRQITWSETATNKMLFEAGVGLYQAPFGPYESPGNKTRPLARITEQCPAGCPDNGGIPNLTYRSANWADSWDAQYTWRGSMSYVTGAHNLKVGYGGVALVSDLQNFTNDQNLAFTVSNGRPISLTQSLLPYTTSYRTRNMSLYVQDQWTRGRMTLQGALRFDRNSSFSPEQRIPASNFLSTAIVFPKTPGVDAYKDISPRGGVAYDLFGNGKTAVKVNFGKYLEPTSNNNNYILSNPITRIATTTTRTWTDGNNNFVPDCDLRSPAASPNNVATGGDFCGAMNSGTFGTTVQTTANIDPKILNGWSVRSNDWQIGASVQQQVLPRVSIEVGYFRRWLNNFTVTDNQSVGPADFTPYSITAPSDPALPGGGGYAVDGLYNVVPAKFGQTSNNITLAENFGEQYQRYNGVLFNVSARLGAAQFQGGINTGKTVQDNCDVRAQVPELATVQPGSTAAPGVSPNVNVGNPFCHSDPGFVTKLTALGSYIVPKVDVLVSGTLRSDQGAPLNANWNAPVALVSLALGRPAAVAGTTVPIALVKPGDVWGDRVNALDLRFAKILRFGRVRYNVGIDIINATNSDAILTYNQTYNPTPASAAQRWLAPTSVLTPRFVKVGAQIDF
jgi:hypothetical protein